MIETTTYNKKPSKKDGEESLLFLANSMDGPTVPWTVADLTKVNNKLFMTYHVMASGYDYLTPLGCAIGAALPFVPRFASVPRLQAMGNAGLIAGGTGMGLGLFLMGRIASSNPATPWNEEGIQQRVNGLSHNYRVRGMDLGVWLGIAAAGAAMVANGGPVKLGLAHGALGAMQGVALGSAIGSVSAAVVIAATK